ncbi:MAG: hypothetical protein KAI43_09775 [Candidatus Aureabacteria bacterium]|nr:hypothetical protein [Candidatus Auribacterota bacterium]
MPSYSSKSKLIRLLDKFRYGLILHSIRNRLAWMGLLEISLSYLCKEELSDSLMPEIKCSLEEHSLEFFGPVDMNIIGEENCGYKKERMLAMLKEGKKCFGIKHKGKIASFMWFDFDECNWYPYKFRLKKNEVYLFHLYTMYPFRGKNIAPYLRYKSYEVLKNMNRDTIYSLTEYFNSAAIKVNKKLNMKLLKFILYIELFRRFHWTFTIKTY